MENSTLRVMFYLRITLVGIFLLKGMNLFSQSTILNQSQWQQRLEYVINVELDDQQHILRGNETILYVNNSPNTLNEIYIHLWPNAYRNNETAFAKQQLENKNSSFHYLPEEERGYIDSLNFLVDWVSVNWELTKEIDIAKLTLKRPIEPGGKVRIATTFKTKIPKVVSRLGHEAQLYCITQWYPKPAVYDVNGWNPIPYLDQGEFYSDFGKYEVNITLPVDYIVAATGRLQNKDEQEWLLERSKQHLIPNPNTSKPTKTLQFIQDSIHDFAWFTDKNFQIEHNEIKLPKSQRTVHTWFYAIKPKKSNIQDLNNAVTFYSDKVGEYPYSDVSVVVTPLSSGAGMEYPMITNITEVNRQVITHEVGHNWFYGILASNEREYPWMDESINTYYETRSAETEGLPIPQKLQLAEITSFGSKGYKGLETRYLISSRKNNDQPASLPSVAFSEFNYGAIIYGKAATAFHYLQLYLGDSLFDEMMRSYYEKWKFKHPLPNDFKDHVANFTTQKTDWFFNDILGTSEKQDWKLKSIQKRSDGYHLKVNNKSNFNAPFSISGIKQDSIIETQWITKTDSPIQFKNGDYDYFRLDAFEATMDLNRSNNSIKANGIFKKARPVEFRFLGDQENPYKNQIYFLPFVGANLYDKTMIGMVFYNTLLPARKSEYIIAPLYGFGSQSLAGTADWNIHFLTSGKIKRVTLNFNAKQFGQVTFNPETFTKIESGFTMELAKKNPRISPSQKLIYRMILVNERLRGLDAFVDGTNSSFAEVTFATEQTRLLNPFNYLVQYQIGNTITVYHKLSAEVTQLLNYSKPKKGFYTRFYGGLYVDNLSNSDGRTAFLAGAQTGYFDYTYDQSQFGRSEGTTSNSLFGQQLMFGGLAFKELFPLVTSDKWAMGANFETSIPGILPVFLYADIAFLNANEGFFDGNTGLYKSNYNIKLLYTSGISIKLFNDVFRINLPLLASKEIVDYFKGDTYGQKRYTERISFSLNLNKMNPLKKIQNISF